jgi:hypothetical protein
MQPHHLEDCTHDFVHLGVTHTGKYWQREDLVISGFRHRTGDSGTIKKFPVKRVQVNRTVMDINPNPFASESMKKGSAISSQLHRVKPDYIEMVGMRYVFVYD